MKMVALQCKYFSQYMKTSSNNTPCKSYNLKTSSQKTMIMTFKRKYLQKSKINTDGYPLE
jgi:hypothetical protein